MTTQKSRTEYSILNIMTGLGGYAINTILGLICRMVFTRILSADYLGVNGLFTNILTMLNLAELGIGSAIVYALYKPLAENDEEKVASLVKFYGSCYKVIGIVVATIGIILMPFLNVLINGHPAIKENLYVIYALYLFNTASTYFFSYRSSLITAAQQNYVVVGVSYLITIIQSIIQMVWLIVTHEYIGYLIIASIGTMIYNILISYIAKRKFPYIVKNNIKPLEQNEKNGLIRNVRALVVWKLSGILVNSTDNIIITYFSGLSTVGLSSNYTLLSSTLNALLNQLFSGITASVGNLNAKESVDKKIGMFNTINLANFWLFGWASIGIFVLSTDIVRLMFGTRYVLPINIPFIIALNFYMVGIQNAIWTFENTLGLFRQGRYLQVVTAAINLICSIGLGKKWGLFGILFATAIARLFTGTWYDPFKLYKYGFGRSVLPYYRKRLIYFVVLIITGGICYWLSELVKFSVVVNICIKFIICCIIPNLFFVCLFHQSREFHYYKNLYRRIIAKILKKEGI